jgi:mono/diheme cytochrome c family protein
MRTSRGSGEPLIKRMTDEQLAELAAVIMQVDDALASLSEEEQRAYREAQQSVIDARRAGERIARELWIG